MITDQQIEEWKSLLLDARGAIAYARRPKHADEADEITDAITAIVEIATPALLTELAYLRAPAGVCRLFQLDDGDIHWVSAKTPERAVEVLARYVALECGYADVALLRAAEPWDATVVELDREVALGKTFTTDSGVTIPLWDAFEIMREHEGLVATTRH